MGILMLVALLVFSVTRNVYSIAAVIVLGGFMNIINGLSMVRRKERKTMGMSMILLGIIILFAFVIYFSGGYIV